MQIKLLKEDKLLIICSIHWFPFFIMYLSIPVETLRYVGTITGPRFLLISSRDEAKRKIQFKECVQFLEESSTESLKLKHQKYFVIKQAVRTPIYITRLDNVNSRVLKPFTSSISCKLVYSFKQANNESPKLDFSPLPYLHCLWILCNGEGPGSGSKTLQKSGFLLP